MRIWAFATISAFLVACGADVAERTPAPPIDDTFGDQIGSVDFPNSCTAQVQPHLERALALLHHMTYAGSAKYFRAALQADPECAIARWGVAMSWLHPLWIDVPDAGKFSEVRELLREANAIETKTPREADYIAAIGAYYDPDASSEQERLAAFERGWRVVYERYPDDQEAQAFYALALMATATLDDAGVATRARAGAIAEELMARVPDHPGALHYTIHAYDTPRLAEQGLPAAYEYGAVAPNVAHALHMPTHIFTRIGIWLDSITQNQRAEEAALAATSGTISTNFLHALDYEVYARLQSGEDASVAAAVDHVLSMEGPYMPINLPASAYAIAAIPARYAMERQDWAASARLAPLAPASFPWQAHDAPYEAITHFARGVGGARSGDLDASRSARADLARLRETIQTMDTNSYWASQIDVQIQTVDAWLAFAEEDIEVALTHMRAAAQREAASDKDSVTPGEIVPARELLGDMLLAAGEPAEALAAYQAESERSPNRFNSLYGAGKAAELLGDRTTAASYYRQLVANSDKVPQPSGTERPRLREARAFLATQAELDKADA